MTTFAEVRMTAEHYGPDVQFRMQCPFCSDNERSFAAALRANGDVAYICHRAKCGMKGYLPGTPGTIAEHKEGGPKRGDHISMNLRDLTPDEYMAITSKWLLSGTDIKNWKWDVYTDRLAMPVIGMDHNIRGFVLRDLSGEKKPKVLSVKIGSGPFFHWRHAKQKPFAEHDIYLPNYQRSRYPTILVEDIISAARIPPDYNAIALLGTHIPTEVITEIKKNVYTNEHCLIIALDEDASVKALQYQKELAANFTRVKVILLAKDFKDMGTAEVESCLNAI